MQYLPIIVLKGKVLEIMEKLPLIIFKEISMKIADDESKMEWLKKATIESGKKIQSSEIFLSIFSESYKEDPLCALQLGIAIMLGKPIGLLVIKGATVPETLKRLSSAIEIVEKDSGIGAASLRLIKKLKV